MNALAPAPAAPLEPPVGGNDTAGRVAALARQAVDGGRAFESRAWAVVELGGIGVPIPRAEDWRP